MGIYKKRKDMLEETIRCRKENLTFKAERLKILDILKDYRENNGKSKTYLEKIEKILIERNEREEEEN